MCLCGLLLPVTHLSLSHRCVWLFVPVCVSLLSPCFVTSMFLAFLFPSLYSDINWEALSLVVCGAGWRNFLQWWFPGMSTVPIYDYDFPLIWKIFFLPDTNSLHRLMLEFVFSLIENLSHQRVKFQPVNVPFGERGGMLGCLYVCCCWVTVVRIAMLPFLV